MSELDEMQSAPTVLDFLKKEAAELGIKHHPKIGEDKLREKIQEYKDKLEAEQAKAVATQEEAPKANPKASNRMALKREQLQLVRIRLSALNPHMKGLKGQVFSVSNSLVGTVKKYIPFDSPNGWHVPKILVDSLDGKQFQTFREITTPTGKTIKRSVSAKAYSIQYLAPLSAEEWAKIQNNIKATAAQEDY
jgi:hypothetical protein